MLANITRSGRRVTAPYCTEELVKVPPAHGRQWENWPAVEAALSTSGKVCAWRETNRITPPKLATWAVKFSACKRAEEFIKGGVALGKGEKWVNVA